CTILPVGVERPSGGCRGSCVEGARATAAGKGEVEDPSCINGRSAYVELPYTLPQDSALFLLFCERHPDIWFQKLDWIARHGGMALLNVHPDYLRFDGEARGTYPVEFYTRLLEYVRQRYEQSFWQALPREIAAFTAQA